MDGGRELGEARLFESIGDTTLGQIVGRHLDQNFVARQHADAVLAHAAGGMGDDLMFVFEFDPERGVRKQLRHDTGKDRKSTRLNSSHLGISYAVFCLKTKKE